MPGQLAAPTVGDLASLVMRKLWERLEACEMNVSIPDAVALARLAHDQEHDQAIIERDQVVKKRDEALRQASDVLWVIRSSVVRQHGQDAWSAISDEVRRDVRGWDPGLVPGPARMSGG
jgi:hypothetical protein